MTTMNVFDAAGAVVAIEKPLPPSRAAAASSRPVVLSTEDLAVITSIDTKMSTLAGYVDGLETLNTALNGYVDGLEALVTATNGYVDGLETLVTATNTRLTAGATAIAKAEDVASADADVGVPAMAVRKATPANTSGTDGDYEMLQMSAGRLWVSAVLEAASVAIGKLAANSGVVIGAVENNVVATTGGLASTARLLSAAASTNATSVKGSAGRLYKIQGYNAAAAVRYLKLYNKATAPTVGTDTPVRTIALPPLTAFDLDWSNLGYYFSTGIAFALTTGSADADTAALTAGDILGLNMDYA